MSTVLLISLTPKFGSNKPKVPGRELVIHDVDPNRLSLKSPYITLPSRSLVRDTGIIGKKGHFLGTLGVLFFLFYEKDGVLDRNPYRRVSLLHTTFVGLKEKLSK